ncbi:MAG TPA: zf-HC2 domain-containing protein [Candidatus Omnitrophota bacterium]|nr:zf-HC2 domain-containing protein [Candidatus Omnitrophota bacterium]
MDCQRLKEYLYSFLDGQLDGQGYLLVKEHLLGCPLCSLEVEREKKVDSLIRQNIPKENAPFALKETVFNKIEETQKLKVFPFALPQLRLALSSLAVILFIITIPILLRITGPHSVFSDSILSHSKFLQGSLPIEITSNSHQEIKDWFQGKLNFAIMVPQLSQKGFNLIGGRLCHLREKEAAYLVYEKDGHYISVFIIETKGLKIPNAKRIAFDKKVSFLKSEKGYQSILCLKKGSDIGCIFVSDLPLEELLKIVT